MLVKKVLTLLPLGVLALITASLAFVPAADEVAGDPSRQDKLILILAAELEELNPWLITKVNDNEVAKHIFDSIIKANGDYVLEPNLGRKISISEEVVLVLDPDMDWDQTSTDLDAFLSSRFPATYEGIIEYSSQRYAGRIKGRVTPDFIQDQRSELEIPDQSHLSPQRIAFRFRPDLSAQTAKSDIAVAVVPELLNLLDQHFLSSYGRKQFTRSFDAFGNALAWYCHDYGLKLDAYALTSQGQDSASSTSVIESERGALHARLWTDARAMNPDALDPQVYVDRTPPVRVSEHPVVGVTLVENAWWQDYGVRAPVYDQDYKEVRELYSAEGELVPRKLVTDNDWAVWGNRLIELRTPQNGYLRPEPWGAELESDRLHARTTFFRRNAVSAYDVAFNLQFGSDDLVGSHMRTLSAEVAQVRIRSDLQCDIVYGKLHSSALYDLEAIRVIPAHRLTRLEWARQAAIRGLCTLSDLANPGFNPRGVLPAKRLQFSKDPIGSGPLRLFPLNGEDALPRWQSGIRARLERFDMHWNVRERPSYTFLDFYIFDPAMGQETAEIAFLSGGADIYTLNTHQIDAFLAMRDRFSILQRLRLNYEFFAFNMERQQFADKRVRQALAMAVDVEELMTYVANGQAIRVKGPAYPNAPGYFRDYIPDYTMRSGLNAGKTLRDLGQEFFPFDLPEARALLAEAGWILDNQGRLMKEGKQLSFTIEISGISGSRGKMALLARERWKKLGCKVDLNDSEWNVFIGEKVQQRNFDVVVLGWNGGLGFDHRVLWSRGHMSPRGLNFTGFDNPEAERLMKEIPRVYDSEEQKRLFHELFRTVADEVPLIFTFASITTVAVDRHIIWRRPKENEAGQLILDAQGNATYEELPVNHPDIMKYKEGLNSFMHQLARSEKVAFPANRKEPLFAGRQDLGTVDEYAARRAKER